MKHSRLEKLANYGILIVALSALIVSVWQVQLFQNHNKLSVKPYLDYSAVTQSDSMLVVSFSNKGLGPAIIKEMVFLYQGKKYDTIYNLLKVNGKFDNVVDVYNYGQNSIISSGDKNILVKMKSQGELNIKVTIHYETIYEEKKTFVFSF